MNCELCRKKADQLIGIMGLRGIPAHILAYHIHGVIKWCGKTHISKKAQERIRELDKQYNVSTKCPIFGEDDIVKSDECSEDPDDKSDPNRGLNYYFAQDLRDAIGHLFLESWGNDEIAKALKKAGVITAKDSADPESGCFYVYFRTKKDALAFCRRLNKYLNEKWNRIREAYRS